MAMIKHVASKIKTFNKDSVTKASKMCLKCGKVLDLDKGCNCEHKDSEGKTTRVSNSAT